MYKRGVHKFFRKFQKTEILFKNFKKTEIKKKTRDLGKLPRIPSTGYIRDTVFSKNNFRAINHHKLNEH